MSIISMIVSMVAAVSLFAATPVDSVQNVQIIDSAEGITMTADRINENEFNVHMEMKKKQRRIPKRRER